MEFAQVDLLVITRPFIPDIDRHVFQIKYFQVQLQTTLCGAVFFRASKIISKELVIPYRVCSAHIYHSIPQPHIFQCGSILQEEPVGDIYVYLACKDQGVFLMIFHQ